ncbi:3987_t:CDS:1, partial [Acaulospora colombiana]
DSRDAREKSALIWKSLSSEKSANGSREHGPTAQYKPTTRRNDPRLYSQATYRST